MLSRRSQYFDRLVTFHPHDDPCMIMIKMMMMMLMMEKTSKFQRHAKGTRKFKKAFSLASPRIFGAAQALSTKGLGYPDASRKSG